MSAFVIPLSLTHEVDGATWIPQHHRLGGQVPPRGSDISLRFRQGADSAWFALDLAYFHQQLVLG